MSVNEAGPDPTIPLGSCPYPHDWTDDEWLRLMQEMHPTDDVSVAMRKVYEWRRDGDS
jgi:hypothetical protein